MMDKIIQSLPRLQSLFRQNIESFGYHQVTDHNGEIKKHKIITDSGYIPGNKREAMEEMGITVEYRTRPWFERILGLGKQQVVFTFEDSDDPDELAEKRNVIMKTLGIRLPSYKFENREDICRRPIINGTRIGQRTAPLDIVFPYPKLETRLGFDDLDQHISSKNEPTA